MDGDEDHNFGEEGFGVADGDLPRSREDVQGGVTSIDEVLDALSDSTRRFVLYHLREQEVASVDELAREVAARDEGVTPGSASEAAREQASLQLSHAHLPDLADRNFVEFDRRSATVRYSDPPLLLEAVLRLIEELEAAQE